MPDRIQGAVSGRGWTLMDHGRYVGPPITSPTEVVPRAEVERAVEERTRQIVEALREKEDRRDPGYGLYGLAADFIASRFASSPGTASKEEEG